MKHSGLMRPAWRVVPMLCVGVLLAACSAATPSTAATPDTAATPGVGTTKPASSPANTSAPTAASSSVAPTAAATTTTAVPIAVGPKATNCRQLLSDAEVRQATGLANATLKSFDLTLPILSETHCTFDAGTATVDVSVWSGDRLVAFDTVGSGMPDPVALDIPGATASLYVTIVGGAAMARTADHGVAVNLSPEDQTIPDMKAAATTLLRLVLGRI